MGPKPIGRKPKDLHLMIFPSESLAIVFLKALFYNKYLAAT